MTEPLSTFDIKILEQLQKDCSVSTVELAEIVGLSQSPCWRRLQRLKDEGYIKSQVAILDREKLGFGLHIFAYLKVLRLSEKDRATFSRKVQSTPEMNLPGVENVNSTATLGEIKSTTAVPVRGNLAL